MATPLCLTGREMVSHAISGLRGAAQTEWRAMIYNSPMELSTLEEVEATLLHQFDVPRTQLDEWEE